MCHYARLSDYASLTTDLCDLDRLYVILRKTMNFGYLDRYVILGI
jgi:hypothetical protein